MKLYFSMWAYRDPSRVGYDSIEANFYLNKPSGFKVGYDGQTEYFEVEIPDTFTIKEAKIIGEMTSKLLLSGYYSNAQRAVNIALEEYKKEQEN